MSFLSCIGKKSKKRKSSKNELFDKKQRSDGVKDEHTIGNKLTEDDDKVSKASTCSIGSYKKTIIEDNVENDQLQTIKTENNKLQVDKLNAEIKIQQEEARKTDDIIRTYFEDARRLEVNNLDLKMRLTKAEAEAARLTVENRKLLQTIVGMEENQAMMSRAELQSMITQLEEAEQKSSSKSAAVLSGIRTNPIEVQARRNHNQTERQMSFKLTKAEARLSQSEDENQLLRDDLKDMLDSHAELQLQMLSESGEPVDNTTMAPFSPYDAASVCSDSSSKVTTPILLDTQSIGDIHTRLAMAELDQKQLSQDYINLQESYLNLQTRLQCAEDRNTQLQTRITQCDNENKALHESIASPKDNKEEVFANVENASPSDTLTKRLDEYEVDQVALQYDMTVLEGVCEMLGSRLDNITDDYNHCRDDNENLTKQGHSQKNELEKTRNELNLLRDEHNRLLEENTALQQRLSEINGTETSSPEVESLQSEIAELQQKYEHTLQRLEDATMLKNPGNLTTPRKCIDVTPTPTELAEKFRNDLYANDWTQAYNFLTGKLNRTGKAALNILLEICTEAYLFSKRAARYQMETMVTVMTSPTANPHRSGLRNGKRNNITTSSFDKLPEDIRSRLVHFRSNPTEEMIKTCTRDFLNQIDYDRTRFLRHVNERELNEIMTYIRKCCELCWCMVVQDPPMYLLFKVKHGLNIDRERFDRTDGQGQRVDFVVWPSVLADENGPCLQRGVVQALPDRR